MYGENSGEIRAELTVLLRHHRIQQRLGGKGTYTVPGSTTFEERQDLGRQIARYRQSILLWCVQASRAANPHSILERDRNRSRGPSQEFHHRLAVAVQASPADLPPLEELAAPQRFPILESWRLAARAAALGEHDFGAGVEYGRLSDDQCMTVLKDSAEIVRAVVGLDRRYVRIPGWEPLKDQGRLARAAEVCAAFAGYDEPDYTVDRLGWRPAAQLDRGSPPRGFGSILHGEYNLLVSLNHFPDAQSLRLVVESQRIVSHVLAGIVRGEHSPLAEKWDQRTATYKALVNETRNVRGISGSRSESAGFGSTVAARARKLTPGTEFTPTQVRQLNQLFDRIDSWVADTIERGVAERHYFLRMKLPEMATQSEGLVHQANARYVPIDSPVQTQLMPIVRERLRPPPKPPSAPRGASQSRIEFEAAIAHRPGDSGPTLAL